MTRVLIADDSVTVRTYLEEIIKAEKDLELVGMAQDGAQAVKMVPELKPDVVVMDIQMPNMNGLDATRRIMEENPVPIVINSALLADDQVEKTCWAMEAGAVSALEKPEGPGHPRFQKMAKKLVDTIRVMSGVKVVRRNSAFARKNEDFRKLVDVPEKPLPAPVRSPVKLVVMGASTGGQPAIRTILSNLSPDFSVPTLIVLHIGEGFIKGTVNWMDKLTPRPVRLAEHNMRMEAGHVYFAPDHHHMGVTAGGRIILDDGAHINNMRPAVSFLFHSAARSYGNKALGVILSGMGKDGAEELKVMRDRGAVTIAQSKATATVNGMPGEAVKIGAATHAMSPEEIAGFLNSLGGKDANTGRGDGKAVGGMVS
ncbi:MAG: chemotaxis-specific protein-glutamate methyltransferase CheB [Desulfatibacillaceae bacterium]